MNHTICILVIMFADPYTLHGSTCILFSFMQIFPCICPPSVFVFMVSLKLCYDIRHKLFWLFTCSWNDCNISSGIAGTLLWSTEINLVVSSFQIMHNTFKWYLLLTLWSLCTPSLHSQLFIAGGLTDELLFKPVRLHMYMS